MCACKDTHKLKNALNRSKQMNANNDIWYILTATRPLEARNRLERLKTAYIADKRACNLYTGLPYHELRVPNEYIGDRPGKREKFSGTAHDYLFRYIFIKADLNRLDEFLRYRKNGDPGIHLLMRRNNERTLKGLSSDDTLVRSFTTAATIKDSEVTRFFTFCEAYARYHEDKAIPFLEFTPDMAKAGDRMEVTGGPYEGQLVIVESDDEKLTATLTDEKGRQQTVPAMQVCTAWFNDTVGVSVTIPRCYLKLRTPRKYLGNSYGHFDEFFDFVSRPEVCSRILAGHPDALDCAKAVRMIHTARYEAGDDNSKRLKVLNLCALTVSHYILGEWDKVHRYLRYWEEFRPTIKTIDRFPVQGQLFEAIIKIYKNNHSKNDHSCRL